MRKTKLFASTVLLSFIWLVACAPTGTSPQPGPEAAVSEVSESSEQEDAVEASHPDQKALVFETSSGEEINYLLYLPANLDEAEEWPMILYLHGSDGNGGDIELVRDRSLPGWATPEDLSQFLIISPQLPSGNWESYFDQLDELLEYVDGTLPVDADAQFVTGYSIGGLGSWQYALRAPERFAALIPVAGGPTNSTQVPVPDDICLLESLAIWVFHGDLDTGVPIERNIAAIEALEDCGNIEIQFTSYTEVGHSGTWQMAYADPALYVWMLEQIR